MRTSGIKIPPFIALVGKFIYIVAMILAVYYLTRVLSHFAMISGEEVAFLGPIVLGKGNRWVKALLEMALTVLFTFIFFMSFTMFWILILGYIDPLVPSILEFLRHHDSLTVINLVLASLATTTLYLYIETQDVKIPDKEPFINREVHPMTCDSSGGTKCERVSKTGEGVLILQRDHFKCPCGKYKQSFHNTIFHEP